MNRLISASRSRWLRVVLELALAAAVFAGAYRVAHRHLTLADAPTFIYWELKPAVMLACGYGFVQPGAPTPAVDRFIYRKSDSVSCQDFAWGGAPTEPIGIAFANRYSLYGAAWAMRLGGISWQTLDSYLGFLFGISMAFTYGIYRMAVGRVLAIAGVIAVACSPGLMEIVALRDFIKLPCFTALWLVLAWVVRDGLRRGPAATLVPMTAGGVLLGLGIGLRMDALVFLPIFIGIVLVVVPDFSWRGLGFKAGAAAAFVAAFLVTGRPILTAISSGSNSAHVVALGLMTPFDRGLAIDPAPYDIGAQYSDGYAYTVIVSDALLKQGERLPILLASADYDRVGGQLLRKLASTFPADVVTRALGATWQIFRYPFDWRIRDTAEKMPAFQEPAWLKSLMAWRTWALAPFAERELSMTLMVLVIGSAFNWRLGILGLALILYFCGYSMLQFSRRHHFHLDVIPVLIALLAVQLPIQLAWRIGRSLRTSPAAGADTVRGYAKSMAIGAAVLAGSVLLGLAGLQGLRWWQQSHVAALVERTLAASWEPSPVTEEPLADTMMSNGQPSASWYDAYMRHPDQWRSATLLRVDGVVPRGTEAGHTGDLRQRYFKVTIEDRCDAAGVMIGMKYTGAGQSFDYEFTRVFTVMVAPDRASYVLTPAYYHLGSSWNRFDGFAVPERQRRCITSIERARQPSALPMPVVAFALDGHWRDGPLYQQLLDRPAVTSAGTPVDPLPTDAAAHGSGWRGSDPGTDALALRAPPLDEWSISDGVTVTRRGDAFAVAGNTVLSGYQLMSPALDVPARQVVAFQIVGAITRGEMCVGVLDGAQRRWLLAPTNARVGLLADTLDYTQVRLVFSNCANPPGEFTVRAVNYEAFPRQ